MGRDEHIALVLARMELRTQLLDERGAEMGYCERTCLNIEQRCDIALLRKLVLPVTPAPDRHAIGGSQHETWRAG
jgi:hypothetical protein